MSDLKMFTFIFVVFLIQTSSTINNRSFPENFKFGVATSSYQIEGAWNVSGKGEGLWDHITHTHPYTIADESNGDVACDSYNRLDEDIAMLKNLGVNFYRFSVSWSRIVPTGNVSDGINQDGVRYYHDLLDKLKEAGMDAMLIIFHYDPPEILVKNNLFIDEKLNSLFVDFSKLLFDLYADKVKYWNTFNEPQGYCVSFIESYSLNPGKDSYLCAHNILKSHGMVYRLFDRDYRKINNGQITLNLNTDWNAPTTSIPIDVEAAERMMMFQFGWFAHPVIYGDYPEVMKKRIRSYSLPFFSRLPKFTEDEKRMIKGSVDFISLNHYSTMLVQDEPNNDFHRTYEKDRGVLLTNDPSWEPTIKEGFYVVPSGFRAVLKWIKKTYDIPIFVTENGYVDAGGLEDDKRVAYLKGYWSSLLDAIYLDGVEVLGHTYWSLMDNFEWTSGYVQKFGLYSVNFSCPIRERTAKKSATYFKKVLAARSLVVD